MASAIIQRTSIALSSNMVPPVFSTNNTSHVTFPLLLKPVEERVNAVENLITANRINVEGAWGAKTTYLYDPIDKKVVQENLFGNTLLMPQMPLKDFANGLGLTQGGGLLTGKMKAKVPLSQELLSELGISNSKDDFSSSVLGFNHTNGGTIAPVPDTDETKVHGLPKNGLLEGAPLEPEKLKDLTTPPSSNHTLKNAKDWLFTFPNKVFGEIREWVEKFPLSEPILVSQSFMKIENREIGESNNKILQPSDLQEMFEDMDQSGGDLYKARYQTVGEVNPESEFNILSEQASRELSVAISDGEITDYESLKHFLNSKSEEIAVSLGRPTDGRGVFGSERTDSRMTRINNDRNALLAEKFLKDKGIFNKIDESSPFEDSSFDPFRLNKSIHFTLSPFSDYKIFNTASSTKGTGAYSIIQDRPPLTDDQKNDFDNQMDNLITEILEAPLSSDEAQIKVAEMSQLYFDVMPDARGVGWQGHIAAVALLQAKGFKIGRLETKDDSIRRLDLSSFVEPKDRFIQTFPQKFTVFQPYEDSALK
jgi:hypothetical protein